MNDRPEILCRITDSRPHGALTVREFLEELGDSLRLRLVAGEAGMGRNIRVAELNRPGLALAGYFDYFASLRAQVLGKVEIMYLRGMKPAKRRQSIRRLIERNIPCCIVTRNYLPPPELMEEAEASGMPLFRSPMVTMRLINLATLYLENRFSPSATVPGDLIEAYGVGVLILGKSGVGKSECALALLKKGHRLIADDVVRIRLQERLFLVGAGSKLTRYHMEIRGLGIINVQTLFGAACIKDESRIDLVMTLEDWERGKEYDRTGMEEKQCDILGITLPHLLIPVRPGRDVALLVETAALNHRLRELGVHSSRELNELLLSRMRG